MTIKNVVFDVDDTLYDQQAPFNLALQKIFPKECHKIDFYQAYIRFRYHSDETFHLYTEGKWTLPYMRYYRINEVLKEFNFDEISETKGLAFQNTYEKALADIQLLPESKKLLDQLTALKNLQLAVITNGPTDHQAKKIQQLNLSNWMPEKRFIISESAGVAKPDPEIFALTAEKCHFEPHETLYIGDNFENDIEAAKKAGWHAIWFNHRKRNMPSHCQQTADATINDFSDLPETTLHYIRSQKRFALK